MFGMYFTGNVSSDITTREVTRANGEKVIVANFNLAVNTGYGENRKASFFRIAAWGKQGEACAKYLTKGRKVGIETEVPPTVDVYLNKEGNPAGSLNITATRVEFLGSSNGQASSAAPETHYDEPVAAPEADDLPF